MAQALYDAYKEDMLDSSAPDLSGGSIDVIFVTSSYTFSAAHDFFDDLTNTAGDGGSARANAENLANPSVTGGTFDADDVTFASVTGTNIAAFVVFFDNSTDANSNLIGYFDSITTFSPSAQEVTITFDASGIFYL